MIGMPYFNDPVKLGEFGSFQQGINTIQKNLDGGKGKTAQVYEIIDKSNNTATMLHGRYRFASHWPELTMKTFTKIMSSPGEVEDAMNALMK